MSRELIQNVTNYSVVTVDTDSEVNEEAFEKFRNWLRESQRLDQYHSGTVYTENGLASITPSGFDKAEYQKKSRRNQQRSLDWAQGAWVRVRARYSITRGWT